MNYFGKAWDVPALDDATQVETPIGQSCLYCKEQIADGDRGSMTVYVKTEGVHEVVPIHVECQLLGIVGHDWGICRCTGYDTTARAPALLLWQRMAIPDRR